MKRSALITSSGPWLVVRPREIAGNAAHVREPPDCREQFATVVEQDDAVTQQAPALLRVRGDGAGRLAARLVR